MDYGAGKKNCLAGNKFGAGKRWRGRGILFGGIFTLAGKGNHPDKTHTSSSLLDCFLGGSTHLSSSSPPLPLSPTSTRVSPCSALRLSLSLPLCSSSSLILVPLPCRLSCSLEEGQSGRLSTEASPGLPDPSLLCDTRGKLLESLDSSPDRLASMMSVANFSLLVSLNFGSRTSTLASTLDFNPHFLPSQCVSKSRQKTHHLSR